MEIKPTPGKINEPMPASVLNEESNAENDGYSTWQKVGMIGAVVVVGIAGWYFWPVLVGSKIAAGGVATGAVGIANSDDLLKTRIQLLSSLKEARLSQFGGLSSFPTKPRDLISQLQNKGPLPIVSSQSIKKILASPKAQQEIQLFKMISWGESRKGWFWQHEELPFNPKDAAMRRLLNQR